MAITNTEIIKSEMLIHGITEAVNTYAGWKLQGLQVKKGSKALFKTQIWKPCKVKIKTEEGDEIIKNKLYMVNAAFFGRSQTEAMTVQAVK